MCHYKPITGSRKAYDAVLEGNFLIVISKFIQKDIGAYAGELSDASIYVRTFVELEITLC